MKKRSGRPSRHGLHVRAHCVYRCVYHVIFVTKYRREAITEAMLAELNEIVARICADWGCGLIEFGGEADHIHLLIEAIPDINMTRLINNLKTVTSKQIRRNHRAHLKKFYWKPFFWSPSYCIITAGGATIEVLKRYIETQGEVAGA